MSSAKAILLLPFVITLYEVTSDPVPLVVGIAINNLLFSFPRRLKILSPKYRIPLQASIGDPPPSAITHSGSKVIKSTIPFCTISTVGFGSTLLNIFILQSELRFSIILSVSFN